MSYDVADRKTRRKTRRRSIFMYDVASQSVSKLSGDLSTAFVDAAESNSDSTDSFDDSSFPSH